MVAPVTRTKKRAREDECCPNCGRRQRAGTASTLVLALPPPPSPLPLPPLPTTRFSFSSTVTSPLAHDLTAAYATEHLSPEFGLFKPFLPAPSFRPVAASPRDFTLQVTAQAVPLPVPMCDPPVALRLCFVRCWLQRRPLPLPALGQGAVSAATSVPPGSSSSQAEEEGLEEVCQSRSHFVGQFQSSAARFFSSDTALADIRHLLACAPGCDDDPWASMPIARFTAEAAARIHRFVRDRRLGGSLGPDRFICHLDITALLYSSQVI